MNTIKEIWKPIQGFEELYEVSNLGHIRSLRFNKKHILKPQLNNCGYLIAHLSKDNKLYQLLVHRLVAFAFVKNTNPEKYIEVNHIDECKTNNAAANLQWCTHAYNINYGTRGARQSVTRRKNSVHKNARLCYNNNVL